MYLYVPVTAPFLGGKEPSDPIPLYVSVTIIIIVLVIIGYIEFRKSKDEPF